jgi:hypothetical protein
LKPSVVVTAADLARPACAFPNSRLATSLPVGKTPLYLGQPVPVLILRISTSLIRRVSRWAMQLPRNSARKPAPVKMPNYSQFPFTRVGGPTPDAPDVYLPVKNGSVGLVSSRARGVRSGRAGGFQASPHQQQFCLFWRRFRCRDHTPFPLYAALVAMFFANVRCGSPTSLEQFQSRIKIQTDNPGSCPSLRTEGRSEQIRKKPPGEEPSGFYNRGNASHDGTVVNSAERALVPPIPEPLSPNRRWGVASTEL